MWMYQSKTKMKCFGCFQQQLSLEIIYYKGKLWEGGGVQNLEVDENDWIFITQGLTNSSRVCTFARVTIYC